MTQQEAFNKVWQWFVVEKHPKCSNDGGRCFYRKEDNKCAVGVNIPDREYHPLLEGKFLEEVVMECPSLLPLSRPFWRSLQTTHDSAFPRNFTNSIRDNLIKFAEEYHLMVPKETQ